MIELEFGKHIQRGVIYAFIIFAVTLVFYSGMVLSVNGIYQALTGAEGTLFPSPYYELLLSLASGLSALGIEWSKASKETT